VSYCAECGSAELSTPAPPASFLHHLSGFALYGFASVVGIVVMGVVVLSALRAVDWQALSGPLVSLLLMLGILYWTTTLIPGPIKRIARSIAGGLAGSSRKEKKH
jgi:hypothetical protein